MRRSQALATLAIVAVIANLAAALPAHASRQASSTPSDPFEKFNRANFRSSRAFEKLLRPVLALYRLVTPGPVGKAIHNLLVNAGEPVVIINYLLQLRVGRAGEAGARLAFNTSLGIGGLIDVAGKAGNPHHDNSFGDTLGRWGAGPGPYLFLPFFGPTTVRDLAGFGVDTAINPMRWVSYTDRTAVNLSVSVASFVDTASSSEGDLDVLLAGAADPYATLRSVYLQSREAEIHESASPASRPDLVLPPLPTPDDAPQGATGASVPDSSGAETAPPSPSPAPADAAPTPGDGPPATASR